MNNKIIIINGPNINLLGEREQSQYGSISFDGLKKTCLDKINELSMNGDFFQSNVEGEIVNKIQESRKSYDGIIINAAAFTHSDMLLYLPVPTINRDSNFLFAITILSFFI